MSPGSVTGTNLVVCSYGKLQPGRPDSNKDNSHIPKMEIQTRQKLCHFGRYVAKAKLFCQKSSVPVILVGVFIWVNFHPGYRDLGRNKAEISVTGLGRLLI